MYLLLAGCYGIAFFGLEFAACMFILFLGVCNVLIVPCVISELNVLLVFWVWHCKVFDCFVTHAAPVTL